MYNKGITILIGAAFLFVTYATKDAIGTNLIFIYLAIINVIGLMIMVNDKKKAQRNSRRIPEQVMFRVAAIGGGIGSLVGMNMARHKTKKWYFRLFIPLLMIVDCVWIIYWYL